MPDGLVSLHESSSGVRGRREIDASMPRAVVARFASVREEEGFALNLVRRMDFRNSWQLQQQQVCA